MVLGSITILRVDSFIFLVFTIGSNCLTNTTKIQRIYLTKITKVSLQCEMHNFFITQTRINFIFIEICIILHQHIILRSLSLFSKREE